MRGDAQDIDISKSYIDKLFSEKDLLIASINLSGGEPTLNEDLIEYIIDKIIREKRFVLSLQMTTNGLIFSEKIIEYFNRFYDYVKENLVPLYDYMELRETIATIRLSNDQYHLPITNYKGNLGNIELQYTGNKDFLGDEVILAGRARNFVFGTYYDYKLKEVDIRKYKNVAIFMNAFYLTATGYITNNGDGEYKDMDMINFGHIDDFSFERLINQDVKKLDVNLHK